MASFGAELRVSVSFILRSWIRARSAMDSHGVSVMRFELVPPGKVIYRLILRILHHSPINFITACAVLPLRRAAGPWLHGSMRTLC